MSSLEVRGTPENNLSSLEVRYASLLQRFACFGHSVTKFA